MATILPQECALDAREAMSTMEENVLIPTAKLSKGIYVSSVRLILQYKLMVFVTFMTLTASNQQ